jgi:serine/threonine protein kinase/class 3 adenylate cyclase
VTQLGQYHLLTQIGAGRDGVAYRAQSADGMANVEVRDIEAARDNPDRWARLVPRLRMASQVAHPAVVRILELATDHSPPYLVLEWYGDHLARMIRDLGPIAESRAVSIVHSLAGALSAAHRLGLVHGRVCPTELSLDGRLNPRLDFTGTEVHSATHSAEIQALDAACRAPELSIDSTPGRPADVYGLGALLSCLLRDRSPIRDAGAGDLARTIEFGSRTIEPGARTIEQGARTIEQGARTIEQGAQTVEAGSTLAALIQDMTAADPDDRPSAQQAEQRLAEFVTLDAASGEWRRDDAATAFTGSERDGPTIAMDFRRLNAPDRRPETLGRFRLLDLLGEGGQGAVYRAQDTADGSIVALKILRAERAGRPEVLRRFRKEARLMAEANNPYVVNLLEFNEENDVPYLVLEFVAGRNLGDLIAEKTRLDEPGALEIMADVARALAGPHDRGIIHRDIKPANILLLDYRKRDDPALQETAAMPGELHVSQPATVVAAVTHNSVRIKLSDFGLARHVIDSESLAMTAAGALLGTPHYMAPEQWSGLATDPRTDIYAMGATLFEMLTGRPPFTAPTRDELLVQHCQEPVPALGRFNRDVSEGTTRVVEKALSKKPEDRYPDATAMLRDLEALLHGTPTEMAIHPLLPACNPRDVVQFDWVWELEASPRELWPHLSNTERVNRALGLAAPEFTTRIAPEGNVERYASFRKIVPFAWREHPFEWIEGRRFGVLREFQKGVFHWFISLVELEPRSGGGTRVIQRIRVLPRGLGGKLLAHVELGRKGRKNLERVYQRIDAAVTGKLGGLAAVDPFEEPARLPDARRARLDQGLDRLIQAGADPVAVERLGTFLGQAPDPEVARIRPLALAQRLGVDADALVAACLQGSREGVLVLLWDLLCPLCRISSEIKDTLRAIRDHGHCPACNLDYALDFASSVELVFRVHPEIRSVDLGTYCIGGPAHSPHVLAQVRVAAGERIELPLELTEGSYRIRGPQLPWSVDFHVTAGAPTRLWEIDLATGPRHEDPRTLRAGHQVVTFVNDLERELVVRMERTVERTDALTAAKASSMALFRELFPAEVLSPGQLATVSTISLLAAELDPAQADEIYRELGDSRAFNVVHELFRLLDEAVRGASGAVVKTVGEGLLAAFGDPAAAVRLGLQLQAELAKSELTRDLRLRIAIHRGTALAANINDHLDYFGTTARLVFKLLKEVQGGELALAPAVAADLEVAALLGSAGIEPEVVGSLDAGVPRFARVLLK